MMKSIEKLRGYKLCKPLDICIHYFDSGEIADEIEAEIESRYMLLPVDADGVPIHLYDKLLKSTGAAKATYGEVVGISDDSVFFDAKQGWEANWSKLTRHVKPRTIEDVLADFASKQHGITKEENDALIAECAAEIRELMEVDR